MMSIIVLGAGGHGRVVAELAELNGYERVVFLDECWPHDRHSGAWSVVGGPQQLAEHDPRQWHCVAAHGDNRKRLKMLQQALALGFHAPVLVHPSASVSRHAQLGEGTVVCAQAGVTPFARIGRGCILNTGCSVDHDCLLEDGVHVSPGARLAGGVRVGRRAWVGMGAVVRERVMVGDDAVIAAGAAVVGNVPPQVTVAGVPARPLPGAGGARGT